MSLLKKLAESLDKAGIPYMIIEEQVVLLYEELHKAIANRLGDWEGICSILRTQRVNLKRIKQWLRVLPESKELVFLREV